MGVAMSRMQAWNDGKEMFKQVQEMGLSISRYTQELSSSAVGLPAGAVRHRQVCDLNSLL
jgi:hypothetical protein